ncbi:tetratricopeptide repeat protein [uncultured Flavobacterium sp.]|uniref:tetratricopeptide repeat protein n=1 Tax=uncultured Flavobacterium sp. TaxID=165435 RepID=UPI0025FA22EE|nr:tetratricopeptide repeat protein [uncultured Flavobacterium sp.]
MNTKDYIHLLNNPYSLNEKQAGGLEYVLSEFPFLQSARAIYLKGLYNQDSFRYNTELKKTAAHTTDRSVLFDFITSEQFTSVQKKQYDVHQEAVEQISVTGIEMVAAPVADKLEESIKKLVAEAGPETEDPAEDEQKVTLVTKELPEADESGQKESIADAAIEAGQNLNIGKPLEFGQGERHSFAEWLQLSKLTPVNRDEAATSPETNEPEDTPLARKLGLIDKFIESSPKIAPAKSIPAPLNIERSVEDNSSLMTETLARVYLEQKKYSKAIQAYEILILKYPEKSVFFADRISDIKTLQQNNN